MPRPALPSPSHPLAQLLHDLRTWPRSSQEQSRRNAMVAATDCARRRAERQEVEDYFVSQTTHAHRDHPAADAQ